MVAVVQHRHPMGSTQQWQAQPAPPRHLRLLQAHQGQKSRPASIFRNPFLLLWFGCWVAFYWSGWSLTSRFSPSVALTEARPSWLTPAAMPGPVSTSDGKQPSTRSLPFWPGTLSGAEIEGPAGARPLDLPPGAPVPPGIGHLPTLPACDVAPFQQVGFPKGIVHENPLGM